jgi:hypothetical protein
MGRKIGRNLPLEVSFPRSLFMFDAYNLALFERTHGARFNVNAKSHLFIILKS